MNEFVGYIYFDRTRSWESHFSTDAHWADGDEDWFLGGTVRTLDDVYAILEGHGFDDEYIWYFIERGIRHDYYILLYNATVKNQ